MQKIDKVDPLDAMFKSKKNAAHCGPLSQFKAIKDSLICYNIELRAQGIILNMFAVTSRALYLLPVFCKKSFTLLCSTVKQFIITHSMTY